MGRGYAHVLTVCELHPAGEAHGFAAAARAGAGGGGVGSPPARGRRGEGKDPALRSEVGGPCSPRSRFPRGRGGLGVGGSPFLPCNSSRVDFGNQALASFGGTSGTGTIVRSTRRAAFGGIGSCPLCVMRKRPAGLVRRQGGRSPSTTEPVAPGRGGVSVRSGCAGRCWRRRGWVPACAGTTGRG